MKIYIDESYIQKKSHLRIFTQACKFFADNNGIKSDAHLIVAVSPFRGTKKYPITLGATDQVTKGIYFITLSNKIANEIVELKESALSILFHELEHVRQFYKGELRYTRGRKDLVWKGRSTKKMAYAKDPSEIMAFRVGDEYANDFLKVFPRRLKK
jgi:hypothetical protein